MLFRSGYPSQRIITELKKFTNFVEENLGSVTYKN
jgi:hypothetical protein